MSELGTRTLFIVTATAHVSITLFALLRLRSRKSVAQTDKTSFRAAPLAKQATPETAVLADDDEPAPEASPDTSGRKGE